MVYKFMSRGERKYIIYYVVIILIIIGSATIGYFVSYILYLLLLLLIVILGIYQRTRKKKGDFDPISFDDLSVMISFGEKEEKIFYQDIKKMKISFYGMKGDIHFPMVMNPEKGDNNKFVIETNEKIIVRYILCENDQDYLRLKLLVRFLQKKGVNLKEKGFNR